MLDKERIDPRLYEALAQIHALRATWLLGDHKAPDDDIAEGLRVAEKALSLNPHMATAFAARGALLLARARAATKADARAEAARGAEEAFGAALRENPTLEREHAQEIADAKALAAH